MGFECSFFIMPRVKGMTAEESLLGVKYCKYLKNKESDWYKKVYTERGIEQTFQEFCGDKNVPDLKEEQYSPFMEYVNQSGYEPINYWCSIGRTFDEEVADELDVLPCGGDNYSYRVVSDKSQLENIKRIVEKYLEKNKLSPVYASYGYVENEDGTIKLVPIDGIVVSFGNVERRLPTKDIEYSESEIYACQNYHDDDEYEAWKELEEVIYKLSDVDLENNWIVFERSY